jgi:hypothetical protein
MSSRPHDRSTRLASPCALLTVCATSPSWTVIESRTRPLGERASTRHGRGDNRAAGIPSSPWQPVQVPGAKVATGAPLTKRVTVRVVPFWIDKLIDCAGTVPVTPEDEGGAGVPVAPHPASNAPSRTDDSLRFTFP